MLHVRPTRVGSTLRLVGLLGVLACALIASGCGGEETAAGAADAAAAATTAATPAPVGDATASPDPSATGDLASTTEPATAPAPKPAAQKKICLDECTGSRSTIATPASSGAASGGTGDVAGTTTAPTTSAGIGTGSPTSEPVKPVGNKDPEPRTTIQKCLDDLGTAKPDPGASTQGQAIDAWSVSGAWSAWEFASSSAASKFSKLAGGAPTKGVFVVYSPTVPGGAKARACIGL